MSKELTPEFKKQISDEAEGNTRDFRDNNDYESGVIKGYMEGYEVAGENYAFKWQQAEVMAARYEKALNKIANQMFDKGVPGCTWGDTEYDSMSAVAGYNQALSNVKSIANEVLTPKQTADEQP